MSVGYNAGLAFDPVERPSGGHANLTSWIYTVSLSNSISERTGVFVELFGRIPASAEDGPAHSVDGGVTYLLRDNMQLDATLGIGASDDADDWFLGVGFSARFPD